MLKIKQAIVVEGKYDKVKLSSIVDTIIIETEGFRIFKDKEKMKFIKDLANRNGILIITDSDSAGFMIRNYLKSCIDESKISHAYIPDIYGKEKRKNAQSKEGKIGVEGVPDDILRKAIIESGVELKSKNKSSEITKLDLYNDGFLGTNDSKTKRLELIRKLNLPERMTTNSLIKVLNDRITYEEYKAEAERLRSYGC